MIEGIDQSFDAVFCVGYHARAADGRGVLSHTFTGTDTLWDVRLNGEPASETRFNAALAGHYGVPVALITGDDVICDETRGWLPHVETAVVKYAKTGEKASGYTDTGLNLIAAKPLKGVPSRSVKYGLANCWG